MEIPANPLLSKCPTEMHVCAPKGMMFTAALFVIAPNWIQPKCPSTVEWDKQIVLYSHNGILHHIEKE